MRSCCQLAGEPSSGVGAPLSARHRPEHTLLYQLVQDYYPAFKAHLAAPGAEPPAYVEREFWDHLECGRLEHGFMRVCCDSCHAEQPVRQWVLSVTFTLRHLFASRHRLTAFLDAPLRFSSVMQRRVRDGSTPGIRSQRPGALPVRKVAAVEAEDVFTCRAARAD